MSRQSQINPLKSCFLSRINNINVNVTTISNVNVNKVNDNNIFPLLKFIMEILIRDSLEAGAEAAASVVKKIINSKEILFWVWLPEEHPSECIMN